jgi:hypothetical protein
MRGRPDQEARRRGTPGKGRGEIVACRGILARVFRATAPSPRRGRATRLRPLPAAPTHPTQAWAMEGAAPDGNRGPNGGRPRRCAPLPPPAAAPRSAVPTGACKTAPGPPPRPPSTTTLAVLHTSHSPGDDESCTLIGKNRTPLGWVTFQPLAWVNFRALPAGRHGGRLVATRAVPRWENRRTDGVDSHPGDIGAAGLGGQGLWGPTHHPSPPLRSTSVHGWACFARGLVSRSASSCQAGKRSAPRIVTRHAANAASAPRPQ